VAYVTVRLQSSLSDSMHCRYEEYAFLIDERSPVSDSTTSHWSMSGYRRYSTYRPVTVYCHLSTGSNNRRLTETWRANAQQTKLGASKRHS